MTGSKEAFSELDSNMTDTMKFSDGSRVAIRGRGTIIFRCQNGEHHVLMDVYYIPQLCSSIVSIGQLDECGCEVLIESGILKIQDRERRLLVKVEQLVCLAAWHTEEPWLWHAWFGHLSFDALGRLEKMDEAVEAIKKFKARVEAESDKKLRVLRTNHSGEFTSVEFAAYYVGQGVV
ncbi:uncharacterized protein [Miscanthus floridulus]|uniref:uncharacterized protein n=1 Tax=Miscanthus floridulus TaxID=154761 RepID=UPI00345A4663